MSLWGDISDKWNEYTEHWKSQWERHEEKYKAGAIMVTMGPAATGAYLKVVEQNQISRAREANTAALQEIAQTGELGATGAIQISPGISQWIPFALAFVVVMYLIFKD